MSHYNLAFIGFGNVARALARLLERKSDLLNSKHDITYSVTGIATGSHGFAVNPNGLDINKALELVENKQSIFPLSSFQVNNSLEVIQHSNANVMFENSVYRFKNIIQIVDIFNYIFYISFQIPWIFK